MPAVDPAMRPSDRNPARAALLGLAIAAGLAVPGAAAAAPTSNLGELTQLAGSNGCLADASSSTGPCASARALQGPGPFLGSQAITLSPDGRSAYVASSKSDAIAIFERSARTGELTQNSGRSGCIAAKGAEGCATAIGLDGPNSVAVSPDGKTVYATSRNSSALTTFRRNPASGGLTQPVGTGCVSSLPLPGCTTVRAMAGPDVVVVSPDGENVYVGAFFGSAVAVFGRDASTGALTQPADATGCMTNAPTDGCTTALALEAPEGMAISADGESLFVASAASNALVTFARDPDGGALSQPADGSGCIVNAALAGCDTGVQLSGANAVAVSPHDADVYATSLLSNSVTSFTRTGSAGIAQPAGTTGCMVFKVAVGCSLAHALSAPEGIAVSPDGASVYAAAFSSGAIAVLDRDLDTGSLMQKPRRAGCVARAKVAGCTIAKRINNVSSIVVSSDGRYAYATAFGSDAVDVFRRNTGSKLSGKAGTSGLIG